MKNLILAVLSVFVGLGFSFETKASFIYPNEFPGSFVRDDYSYLVSGAATAHGYVSVFNLDRETVLSLLPPHLGLADLGPNQKEHPVVVFWGKFTNSRGNFGIPYYSGIKYHEWQFFIPGVYRMSGDPKSLRTYVPRMYLDSSVAQSLGERFFYKKVLLDDIAFDIDKGMKLADRVVMTVNNVSSEAFKMKGYEEHDSKWEAILKYLLEADIMGENGEDVSPRCTGFKWKVGGNAQVIPADVSMAIEVPLVEGMSRTLRGKTISSVASYRTENWDFYVPYFYKECP